MNINILAVGDVVGDSGVDFLCRHLPALRKLHGIHFTVVCGENAACNGLLPRPPPLFFLFHQQKTAVFIILQKLDLRPGIPGDVPHFYRLRHRGHQRI